jgi:hypothetical protein
LQAVHRGRIEHRRALRIDFLVQTRHLPSCCMTAAPPAAASVGAATKPPHS